MAQFCFSQPGCIELSLIFPTYCLKFNSYQNIFEPSPITSLYFQRFVSFSEYNFLPYLNLSEKLFAQLVIPDLTSASEFQKYFCNVLVSFGSNSDVIIAELIDETADFLFLIMNFSVLRLYNSTVLGVFRFGYNELWNMSTKAAVYLRNLQLSNSFLIKQCLSLEECYNCTKTEIDFYTTLAMNNESQLVKLIDKVKKNRKVKAKKNKVKVEMPPLECLLCYSHPKNIVFLPCGHVVACKICTTQNLNIEIGKVINQRRSPRTCPICKGAIKEAREVFV